MAGFAGGVTNLVHRRVTVKADRQPAAAVEVDAQVEAAGREAQHAHQDDRAGNGEPDVFLPHEVDAHHSLTPSFFGGLMPIRDGLLKNLKSASSASMALVATMAVNMLITTPIISYTHLRAHETVLDLVCRLL